MKIAVSSTGKNIDSQLNPRFGRCEFFIVVETDDMSFESFENENTALSSGAGIQSASFVASKGVHTVLTGNCGPKAAQTFSAAGVNVLTGYSGTVKQVIEQFKIEGSSDQSMKYNANQTGVPENNRMPPQTGKGMGMGDGGGKRMGGSGRGMGGGGRCMGGSGRGMGGGMGMGMGMPQTNTLTQSSPISMSKEEELNALKEQAEQLKKQMETITKKIDDLE